MIKEIKYGGFKAHPSDYECQDGDLAAAINLINEDGHIAMIPQPCVVQSLAPFDCLCIHNAGGVDRLILYSSGGHIYVCDKGSEEDPSLIVSGFSEKPAVAILGNTLIISDGSLTAYLLYSTEKEKYIHLGQAIPEISISFALSHSILETSYTDSATLSFPEDVSLDSIAQILQVFSRPGGGNNAVHTTNTDIFLSSISNAVVGFLNKMNTQAADENKFLHPFLLRWALRMHDGSYIHHSSPILMVPNSAMPPVEYTVSTTEESLFNINMKSYMRRCSLMFRPSGLSELAKWTDLIKSIDFFISLPVYTYDQSGSIEAAIRNSDSNSIFSHSGVAVSTRAAGEEISAHRHPVSIDPDVLPLYNFPNGNYEAWLSVGGGSYLKPPRFKREHIEAGITSACNFYLVASIPLTGEDAISDLNHFTPLDLNDKALSTLATQPTLPDDWRSHDIIHFRTAYPYNSRLTLAGISSSPFRGFSLQDMSQYFSHPDSTSYTCKIWIKLVRDSRIHWVSVDSSISSGHLPRFLFYPDPSAVEMRIILSDGSGWKLPLKTHDFLNGAYWFDGLSNQHTPKETNVETPASSPLSADESSKIFLSEVNNPFLFPVSYRISLPAVVKGVSSAAKALSQGQFGQFPLYAFTEEGIWALEVSATGTYSVRQPVTRDVCINPESITQIDSAVLFATDRGIMMISGSQTQCISDSLNSDTPFDVLSLPHIDKLHSMLGHGVDTCLPLAPFSTFLKTCRMLYDYVHQRVIAYNPTLTYAYVFSLKSHLWGMMYSTIETGINSYPEALAVNHDRDLLDFSSMEGEPAKGLLVTRPLKLDAPDILKTIDTIIQRGNFRKGHVKTILYASRDLFSWHIVWSSNDHFLRGFRGTPYKYFRIALLCDLAPDESIYGASIQFIPRLTNRPR